MLETTLGDRGLTAATAHAVGYHHLSHTDCGHLVESNIYTSKANTSGDEDCVCSKIHRQSLHCPKRGSFQMMLHDA